jgi:signal transduction histidine kinase
MEKSITRSKCPVTGLDILEDPKWINIPHKNNYKYTFKKIGDSIVFSENSGDMANTDMSKYHGLLDNFIKDTKIKEPFVELRSFNHLTGKPPAHELQKQRDYLSKNHDRITGLVLFGMPLWLRVLTSSAAKLNPTPIQIAIFKDYESGIKNATDILKSKPKIKSIDFNMLEFRDTWALEDKNSDFSYKAGLIPGKVFFSIMTGSNISKENLESVKPVLNQIFLDGDFKDTEYIRIVECSKLINASIKGRKDYASLINNLNKHYNAKPYISYICGANLFIRTTLASFKPFLKHKFVFVDSIDQAFKKINQRKEPDRIDDKRIIKVSSKDINEINTFCGSLFWDKEEFVKENPYKISKNNPLQELIYTLSVLQHDLFEHRRRDEEQKKQLQSSMEDAQAANKIKSEFLSNISHEIRTPLNGIIGVIELLDFTELSEEQNEYIEIIKQSSDTLLQIVTDILDFSKLETDKPDNKNIDFNLKKQIQSLFDTFLQKAHEKNLEFQYNIDNNIPDILKGDPDRLSQIIKALTDNAIKFTDQGSIWINISIKEENKKTITLLFEILDTGIGIKKEQFSSLFDLFTQGDGSMTRQYGGTGLGLATAKQITELMNGKIGVKKRKEQGSVFWFEISFTKIFLE